MFRCLVILFLLLFAGCASRVYSHYPKVKHQAKSEGHQPTQTKKQLLVIETLELKRVEKQTIAIIPPTKADFILVNQPYTTSKQITKPTQKAAIEGDGRPRDATHYNKNAKVAFAAAIDASCDLVPNWVTSRHFIFLFCFNNPRLSHNKNGVNTKI